MISSIKEDINRNGNVFHLIDNKNVDFEITTQRINSRTRRFRTYEKMWKCIRNQGEPKELQERQLPDCNNIKFIYKYREDYYKT